MQTDRKRKRLLHTLPLHGLQIAGWRTTMMLSTLQPKLRLVARRNTMKLPLISASIVAYTLMAVAWICQTNLVPPYFH